MNKGELELFDKFESNPKKSQLRQFKEPLKHNDKGYIAHIH